MKNVFFKRTAVYNLLWKVKAVWFGWGLWHINPCRLFNAKSSLYIYIKYIWFVNILQLIFLNEPELFFFGGGTQLNGFKYYYLILIIRVNINHLFADSEAVINITS